MFECAVAKLLRRNVENYFGINIGQDFESVARWWISGKRNRQCAKQCVVCAVFSGQSVDKDTGARREDGEYTLKRWSLICREENKEKLERVIGSWEIQATMKSAIYPGAGI
jgi:hypothetical protein